LHAIGSTINLSPTPYIVWIHILVGVVQQPHRSAVLKIWNYWQVLLHRA